MHIYFSFRLIGFVPSSLTAENVQRTALRNFRLVFGAFSKLNRTTAKDFRVDFGAFLKLDSFSFLLARPELVFETFFLSYTALQ